MLKWFLVCLQSEMAISSGCSLEFAPKLGGISNYYNLRFSQKLRPEFGNATMTATVLGITDRPMKVRYEFKIEDMNLDFLMCALSAEK